MEETTKTKAKHRRSSRVVENYIRAQRALSARKRRMRVHPDWSRISPRSHFAWAGDDLASCVKIAFDKVGAILFQEKSLSHVSAVNAAIHETFGVHASDLAKPYKVLPIVVPRQIAMTLLYKLGHSKLSIGAAYNRDKTCADVAIRKYYPLVKELSYAQHVENVDPVGPARVAEQSGPLPNDVPS